MPNGSLVIYDVTTEDSGKYTCIAGNSCNIKHREAFLYVVGKEGTQCRDMASWYPQPCFWSHQWVLHVRSCLLGSHGSIPTGMQRSVLWTVPSILWLDEEVTTAAGWGGAFLIPPAHS